MKKIIKLILLLAFSLATQNQFWGNLQFNSNILTIVKVAIILAIFEMLIKPIIKLILFPINILTLGTFRIVINTIGFYLAAFILSDFRVLDIHTSATSILGFLIPPINLYGFWAHVVNSTTNSLLLNIFKNIIKPKKENK